LQTITDQNLANETQTESIRVEQVKMLYESMASLLLINLAVSSALVYAFWNVVSQSLLILWLALMLAVIGVRAVIYYSYKKSYEKKDTQYYIRFLVLGSLSAGLLWGAAGIVMFPPLQVEYQLFILLSLLAMVGGSTFSLSIYLPAYFAFAPLALLPITIKLLLFGDSIHITLGIVTLIYLAALTFFNIKINKNFKHSLLLRFENDDLIKELEIQKGEADKANIAKSKFLAAASHDLRQPLYSLGLFATVLNETTKDPEITELVEQINLSVKALQEMFDVLLDISQLDAGLVSTEKSNIDSQSLFSKLSREFTPLAEKHGLKIIWPEVAYGVETEENLLGQILRNYISNAIRYTDSGTIVVNCDRLEDAVKITVTDTGLGIPEEKHQLIFEEFYQLGNPERDRTKGLGLGLSIVKRAADLLGHQIGVTSIVGQGASFFVQLPYANEVAQTQINAVESNISKVFDNDMLVVVIDDDASIRTGLVKLLTLWGYKVAAYKDGDEALGKLAEEQLRPGILISDYRLAAGQTGIDVIEKIKSIYGREIPALLITGDTEKQRLQEMNSVDAVILFKPIAPIKLRTFLRNAEQHNLPMRS
jgi:signal transduction histidine kinase/CheY-like chemotaxis protein